MRALDERGAVGLLGEPGALFQPALQPGRHVVGIEREILQHRPAHLEAVEVAPELRHSGEKRLVGVDRRIVPAPVDLDAGRGKIADDLLERGPRRLVGPGPARHVEADQTRGLAGRGRRGASVEPGMAGVAAGEPRHVAGDNPHVAERTGEGSEMIHAVGGGKDALPVDRPEGGLERVGAAEARRADSRAPRMGADGDRDRGRADRGGGTARRAPGRAPRVVGVPRPGRVAAAEGDGHRLAEDRRPALPEGEHRGGVLLRAVPGEQRRAVLGRHIDGIDQVLDADRETVDGGQRGTGPVAGGRGVRGLARAFEIEKGPRHDLLLARLDGLDAALEKRARRVGTVAECDRAVVECHQPVRPGIVACHLCFPNVDGIAHRRFGDRFG